MIKIIQHVGKLFNDIKILTGSIFLCTVNPSRSRIEERNSRSIVTWDLPLHMNYHRVQFLGPRLQITVTLSDCKNDTNIATLSMIMCLKFPPLAARKRARRHHFYTANRTSVRISTWYILLEMAHTPLFSFPTLHQKLESRGMYIMINSSLMSSK